MSIRLRLTIWYSAVLLLGLAAFGSGMWFVLGHRMMSVIESRLAERVEGVRTVLELESKVKDSDLRQELWEFTREVPEGALLQVRDARGRELLPSTGRHFLPAAPGSIEQGYRTVLWEGHAYHTLSQRIQVAGATFDVIAAASLQGTAAILAEFRKFLFLMIPVVLATACLGGYWISRRALSPVDEITRTAQAISVQSLALRLPVPRTGDELQRMSETWNDVLERLEAAVNRIRRFTADASHELRTPIALIRATADLALQRERSVADYQNALANVREESERMTELIEGLLALARADANRLVLPQAVVDMNGIVREVVSSNLALAESKGVVLSADLVDSPPLVTGNAVALRRLLLSLLDNAIKYTPANGHVVVSTRSTPTEVQLAVEDTGSGIEPEALTHIFERFYRADSTRGFGSGAGLGLAIAQTIAEAHGAIIRVESRLSAGSRFYLTLRTN